MLKSTFYHITETGKFHDVSSAAEAIEKSAQGGFIWLSYCKPSLEELTALIEPLGIHPLSIEDCLDDYQVPKIENFPTNTYILFNAFNYSEKTLSIEEMNLFIGANFLITVNKGKPSDQSLFEEIIKHVEIENTKALQGPGFLLHLVMDHIVDRKFIAIDALEDELDKAEDAILINSADFKLGDLQQLRRDLISLRKSLFNEREILVKVCRKDSRFIDEQAIYNFRDIYDHLAKFFELTETYREIVTSLMEMNLSMLNNMMAKAANRTNMTVRRLTFITTIFMPMTLLSGIGGMSEWSMMTGSENWRISYPLFLLAMVVIGFTSFQLFRWLDKRDLKRMQKDGTL
jgi:magnesium transporter